MKKFSDEFFDDLGKGIDLGADGDDEINAGAVREVLEMLEESGGALNILVLGDLVEAVDEDSGDIVILGVSSAEESVKAGEAGDLVIDGVDKADLMADIVGELGALLNAENASVFLFSRFVYHSDELFCFSEALQADNALYHGGLPQTEVISGYVNIISYFRPVGNCVN